MRKRERNLVKFKLASEKFIDAPLSKKSFQIMLEQPIQDILMSLDVSHRLTLVRRAIGCELIKEGLLSKK